MLLLYVQNVGEKKCRSVNDKCAMLTNSLAESNDEDDEDDDDDDDAPRALHKICSKFATNLPRFDLC